MDPKRPTVEVASPHVTLKRNQASPHGPVCSPLAGHHHASVDGTGRRLLLTLVLNLLIPLSQILGGILANSVALISDAIHNFSDFTAILIAYVAHRIGQRGATVRNTFGYRRAEILAAALNVFMVAAAAAFITYEAVQRLLAPGPVHARIVMAIAALGVLGNGLSAWLLHKDARHSLNVRGAFIHMLGDLLTSLVVVLSGLVLLFRPWYWLDPLLSLFIVVFIVKNCWGILKEASAILMNATPAGIDLEAIKTALEDLPGVTGVHHMHAWNVCANSIAFSCHIVVPDQALSQAEGLGGTIREHLWRQFGIDHPVLQFETRVCGNGDILCTPPSPPHQDAGRGTATVEPL